MSASETVDSPDAAETLQAQLDAFVPQHVTRGRWLFTHGHVTRLERSSDTTLTVSVLGSRRYTVNLHRRDRGWAGTCTCPMLVNCKHVAAAAFAWLAWLQDEISPGSPLLPLPSAPPKLSFRQHWEPILADKLGRPLTAEEGAFLGKLAQIFHNLRQSGSISGWDLARLGFQTRESHHKSYPDRPYQGWWDTPPADPLALWQYIAHDIETSGLTVPPFMQPITDTADARIRMQASMRRETVERWSERFQHLVAAADAPAPGSLEAQPALAALELRLCLGTSEWTLQTRSVPAAPWKSVPRTFLDRLARDDSDALANYEMSPATYAFLAVCQQHRRLHYSVEFRHDGRGSHQLLRQLLAHPLARALVVDLAGQPLKFSAAPLAWRLERSAENADDYELTLHLPDGRRLPPGAPHLAGRPDYYLHDGTIYAGPPALDGASATAAIIPAEVIERPDALRILRKFGAKLPAEIEEQFVNVLMRARIECALGFDYLENEILTLQLLAVSDQPPVERAWQGHGWNAAPKVADEKESGCTGKIHSFDLASPHRATSRLAELKVGYDDESHRWTRRVTKSFPDEFVAWRAALPPEIEVLATGELASLLGAPVKAVVNLELTETAAHRDWFDLALALAPEDTTLTRDEIALLLKARGKLVRLPGKGWRQLSVQVEGAPAEAMAALGFDPTALADAALTGEKHRFHALQIAQTAVFDLLSERQAATLRERARAITVPEPPALPAGLRAEMRPYQLEGFHFLAFLSVNRLGGVLADDMGLGKTLQALAWLLWLAGRQPPDAPLRVLVVCPKSVVGNWESETARFAPTLGVVRFTPAFAQAKPVPGGDSVPTIVVANYTQLRLAADYFQAQAWHAVILDEGQFIKTPTAKVAQIARDLPGAHRLILTGTPIENRLLDLWSLFAFALPGLLGTQAAFKRHYAPDQPLALARLRTRVRHFLLRRTKAQVASDLPARTEEDVLVELEGEQARLYQAELKRARAQLLKVGTARELDRVRFHILASLMRLRQICCHPALIDAAHRDAPSAKLDELLERIEALRAEGHQVLVFSQFVTMLEIIRDRLAAAGIEHLLLTGQTEDRTALVARFQAERRHTVFLLSLKAAGFGLNLTAASYVFLFDPWWNPAVEAQAIDRTHRIGQAVPVNAYRFIARGTVEEKIRALQRDKAALAGAIVQEESVAQVLDLDSLRQILE